MKAVDAPEPDRQFASTLANGLEMLLCFSPERTALANRDFMARTGLDKATVSRLAYTLVQLGYLRQDKLHGTYRLAPAALTMGYPLLASMKLRQNVRPRILALAEEVGGMVGVAIRARTQMVYMEAYRSRRDESPPVDIGASFPIMVSANGHAWLARASIEEREKLLNQLQVREPTLYRQRIAQVRESLQDFSWRGYCTTPSFLWPGRLALAVPMARPVNAEIVVFNCTVPLLGRTPAALQTALGTQLVTLVREIEAELGLQ